MSRRPTLIDTHGNAIPRASKVAIAAVLARLVDLTCEGRRDYAMVYCEERALSIMRLKGERLEYGVVQGADTVGEFETPQPAIETFWAIFKAARDSDL